MKLEVVWRKGSDYVRYDLKEIAFPSSLPDPPRIRKRRILTWKERYLAVAARGGMEKLRRALQRLYMTRASAYRDGSQELYRRVSRRYQRNHGKYGRFRIPTKRGHLKEVILTTSKVEVF